jgi:hypothetical protein
MSLDAENRARVSMTATGRFTESLPSDLIFRYWRDIHGVLDARLPGMHSYRQYHCHPEDTTGDTLFERVEGVEFGWIPEHKLSSCAHILFLEQEDVARCRDSELFPLVEDDNLAISARNYHYLTDDGARTYRDETGNGTPQGKVEHPTFAVFFRKQDEVSQETFDAYMDALASRWCDDEGVLRVRVQHLQSVQSQFEIVQAELHHAWIDLVVSDVSVGRRLIKPGDGINHAATVEAIQTIAAQEVYTLVWDGKPTDVGLRGWPAVQVIDDIGAKGQENTKLLELMYGPIVRGWKDATVETTSG